jgi:hypothetical protein
MRADSFHQILSDCNLKANWLPRNSWSENYKDSYNFEDSGGKTHVNFGLVSGSERHFAFSTELTCGHSISISYVQPRSIPLLVMATCVLFFFMSFVAPCGEAYLLRFCREQSYNSAGAWSNW